MILTQLEQLHIEFFYRIELSKICHILLLFKNNAAQVKTISV